MSLNLAKEKMDLNNEVGIYFYPNVYIEGVLISFGTWKI